MDKIISAIFLGSLNIFFWNIGEKNLTIGIITTIIFLIYFEKVEEKIEIKRAKKIINLKIMNKKWREKIIILICFAFILVFFLGIIIGNLIHLIK